MSNKHELQEISFSKLIFNFNGTTTILLRDTAPMVLAVFTITADSDDSIPIIANVGWVALSNAPQGRVEVLFEILRGDTVIYSAIDSSDANEHPARVTCMAHVDTDISSKLVTYTLRARLTLAGSNAFVEGPVTFFGQKIDQD